MPENLEHRRDEFRRFVWNHATDEFQAGFDRRAALTEEEIQFLQEILTPKNLQSISDLSAAIRRRIALSPAFLNVLLQILGLTRNKIIQDIKAYVRQENLLVSTSTPKALFNSTLGAKLASEYLAHQAIRVFASTKGVLTNVLLEAMNQATWPGFIRQERAKRSGHEAEGRLARVLADCKIPFEPEEKATNPLCRDIQIDGVSYDLVYPSSRNALVRVKATVHTANIGQYGESKDDLEIQKALEALKLSGDKGIILLAMIDGVGFESNRAGLDGVLSNATEFCQFRTLWKAVVIGAAKVGRKCKVAIPADQHEHFRDFAARYGAELLRLEEINPDDTSWVSAGDGRVQIAAG